LQETQGQDLLENKYTFYNKLWESSLGT
jgi:hypothetical protein